MQRIFVLYSVVVLIDVYEVVTILQIFSFPRWKVFQCLLLEGENAGPDALRNAERFYISEHSFSEFLNRHSHVKCLVAESNTKMQNSYLILDEYVSNSYGLFEFAKFSTASGEEGGVFVP